jgi:hypothetical protein
MRGSLLAWLLCGLIALLPAPIGRAQDTGIPNPIYVDLYWEASASQSFSPSPAFAPTGTWDGDIAANALAQKDSDTLFVLLSMTKDNIDSWLQSALRSDWVTDLGPYGLTVPLANPVPFSFEIVPDQQPTQFNLCAGATPTTASGAISTSLSDWLANLTTSAIGNVRHRSPDGLPRRLGSHFHASRVRFDLGARGESCPTG